MLGNVRVKPVTLLCAVTIVFTLTLTWNKLNSFAPPSQDLIIQDESTIFEDAEIDPPSWPTQLYENDLNLQQQSIFSPFLFDQHESVYQPVTAVISRVDENENGVLAIVKHLSKYPFIKEIIVYNQFSEPFVQELPQDIRVIEDTSNLQSMGKYTACAAASYNMCYFQDDLWLSPYMDSLYTHSLRYPDLVIFNTRQSNYADYSTWRFTKPEIDLHTGFADLRYGAFVPKNTASSFIDQWDRQDLNTTQLKQADVYFSIWNNQYPYLILNPLLSSGRDTFKGIDTVNNRELVQNTTYEALRILEDSLIQQSQIKEEVETGRFERQSHGPSVADRDVRTSCINDKCLFITNMDPLPLTGDIQFDSTQFNNISEYELAVGDQKESVKATLMYESFHKAVDQDTETCWNSIRAPQSGDYFGLYMVGDIQTKRVIMYVKSRPTTPLQDMFKVSVQHVMYGSWEECKVTALPNRQIDHRLDLDLHCSSHEPLKSIRIEFLEDQKEHFELCGLGLDNFVV